MTNLMNCHGIPFSPTSLLTNPTFYGSGVYMFCRRDSNNQVQVLYIGEAADFSTRLTHNHHCWDDALKLGMNEIHLHYTTNEHERMKTETYLRNCVQTPLNRQGNNGILGALGNIRSEQDNYIDSILAALNTKF